MKKILLIIFFLTTNFTHLYSILPGFFEAFDRRHVAIKEKVLNTLSTKEKQWKQTDYGYEIPPVWKFTFIPEEYNKQKTTNERFSFSEFDFSKQKIKINDLDSLSKNYFSGSPEHQNKRIISKNEREELTETISNGMDTSLFKTILTKVIKTDEYKFVSYLYATNEDLSPEEKKYWFEVFDYLAFEKGNNAQMSNGKYFLETAKKTFSGNW